MEEEMFGCADVRMCGCADKNKNKKLKEKMF